MPEFFCLRQSSESKLDRPGARFAAHSRLSQSVTPSPTTNTAARGKKHLIDRCSREIAGNEPTGGSFRRRQCRFLGRLGTNSPTAKVRMPSTVMTPGAMLVRGHIRIRCCTLWRRRLLVIRLGHRQILRHCNCRQCADNQGAAYKSDIHARLRVLLQIRMPMLSVHSPTRWHAKIVPHRERADTGHCASHCPVQRHANSSMLRQSAEVAITSVVKTTRTPCPGQGQRQVQ